MASSLNDDLEGARRSADMLQATTQSLVRDATAGKEVLASWDPALKAANGDMTKLVKGIVDATKASMAFGRNMGSLGRITEELHSGTEDWVKALSGSKDQVAQIGQGFRNLATQAARYQKDLEAHEDAVRNTRSLLKSYSESQSAIGKGYKAIRDAESKIMRDLAEHAVLTKDIEKAQDGISASTKRMAELGGTLKDLEEARSKAVGEEAAAIDKRLVSLVEEKTTLAQSLKTQQETLESMRQEAVIGAETASNALKELDYKKETVDAQKELNDLVEGYKDSWGGAHAVAGKTLKELYAGKDGLKNMFNMDPKQLRGLREKFKGTQALAADGKFGSGGMGGLIGKGVGAASAVGAGAAGLAANIAGMFPVAAIVGAVMKALWDMANEMDAFYKKYANSTSELVSPITDGKDFKPLVDSFGDMTVGAASLNQKLGMTGDEIVSMYKNIISSGSSLQRTLGQVNPFQSLSDFEEEMAANHKRVAYGMRHGSAVLGTSIEEASKSTGEMLNQLRSPLANIQDQYDLIANSAKRAGLQGAYFMRVIEQSVLSLANYGNFTDVAAHSLEKFSKSGTTSQKTAEDASRGLTELFSDADKNYSLLGMYSAIHGGQGSLDGLLGKTLEEKKKELGTWSQDKIKSDNAGYNKLLADIERMQGIKDIGPSGARYAAMAENGGLFTKSAGSILRDIIKSKRALGGGSVGGKMLDNGVVLRKSGLVPEALIQQFTSDENGMRAGMGKINEVLSGNKVLQDFMTNGNTQKLVETKSEASIDAVYKKIDSLEGVGEEQKAALRQLLATPDTFLSMMKQAKQVDEKTKKVTWGVSAQGLAEDYAFSVGDEDNRVRDGKVKDQSKKVDAITELSKRLQINKDKLNWMVSSSSPMQTIIGLLASLQELVSGILDAVTFDVFGKGKKSSGYGRQLEGINGAADSTDAGSYVQTYGDAARASGDKVKKEEAGIAADREVVSRLRDGLDYWTLERGVEKGKGSSAEEKEFARRRDALTAREKALKELKATHTENQELAYAAKVKYDALSAGSQPGEPTGYATGGYVFAGTRKHGDRLLARINSGEWVVPGETMSNIAKGVEQQASLARMSESLIATSPRLMSAGPTQAAMASAPGGNTEVNINVQGVSADEVLRVFKREFSKTQWKGMLNGKPVREAVTA